MAFGNIPNNFFISIKMEKVGFLCGLPAAEGFAPLRDKKIVKELPKAGRIRRK
jgi:hypothetical protein